MVDHDDALLVLQLWWWWWWLLLAVHRFDPAPTRPHNSNQRLSICRADSDKVLLLLLAPPFSLPTAQNMQGKANGSRRHGSRRHERRLVEICCQV
jgi:hypothetical protein